MKKMISLLFVVIFSLGINTSTISAAQKPNDLREEVITSFDLSKGTQSFITKDIYGNKVIITATKEEPAFTTFSDLEPGKTSTWTISYNSILSYARFKMDVYVDWQGLAHITGVYDGEYTLSIYSVNLADLRIVRPDETSTSSALAEYYFEGDTAGFFATNGWLRADIKNLMITVSFK